MGDTAKPEDFFLQAKDETDDFMFLPPSRPGNKIEPLIVIGGTGSPRNPIPIY